MPRSARLDVPDVLQHVMARGIEGREIFRDKKDREEFLRRLSEVVIKGEGQLFAWSLISNHFHLLLRPRVMPLATMMRRLLTGYAVWHNRRHGRKGHLFQTATEALWLRRTPTFWNWSAIFTLTLCGQGCWATFLNWTGFPIQVMR